MSESPDVNSAADAPSLAKGAAPTPATNVSRGSRYFRPQPVNIVEAHVPEHVARVLALFDDSQWGLARIMFAFHPETDRLCAIARGLEMAMSHLSSLWSRPDEIRQAAEAMAQVRDLSNRLSTTVLRLNELTGTVPRAMRDRNGGTKSNNSSSGGSSTDAATRLGVEKKNDSDVPSKPRPQPKNKEKDPAPPVPAHPASDVLF